MEFIKDGGIVLVLFETNLYLGTSMITVFSKAESIVFTVMHSLQFQMKDTFTANWTIYIFNAICISRMIIS